MVKGWLLIFVSVVLAAPAHSASACEDGLPKVGYLGITDLSCDCTTNFSLRSKNGKAALSRIWTFRSEPVIGSIKPGGPSWGELKEGDVITAVDGAFITTREGSARFSSLQPGQSVKFTVRRDGRELPVTVRVGEICPEELSGVFSLGELVAPRAPQTPEAARPPRASRDAETPRVPEISPVPPVAPVPAAPPAPRVRWVGRPRQLLRVDGDSPVFTPEALPKGWLGIGLSCQECGGDLEHGEKHPVWHFGTLPTVSFVDPEGPSARAGLRRGDQLTHIDGISLVTDEGGRRFGSVKPGQVVRWRVIRDGSPLMLTLTAVQRPGDEAQGLSMFRDQLRALRDANQGMARSREMRDLMRQLGELERAAPNAEPRSAQRRLRYAGSVAGSDVEVRGLGNVVVDDSGDEVIIITRDATIRIRPGEKIEKTPRDRQREKK
ncbi:MAG: PDZ domain-containing protein [Candidatus Eisenbacteria bacterium]